MTDKITLPKETEERIKQDAEGMALCTHDLIDEDSYASGARVEATRALPLLEALKTLRHGLFKDANAVNEFIDKVLMEYN